MPRKPIAGRGLLFVPLASALMLLSACSGSRPELGRTAGPGSPSGSTSTGSGPSATAPSSPGPSTTTPTASATRNPNGSFTVNLAGDVNFSERTATRLATSPATAFGAAARPLGAADLTMVNLETAITTRGAPENKSYTFRAPPTAFTALKAAGVDVATMANNHGADYGSVGLGDTLAAIASSRFPTVGIGRNAAAAYAPYFVTVRGVRLAIVAASQVQDETLANFTAGASTPGIASALSPSLIDAVRTAHARADVVLVYLHWGTEYQACPNAEQTGLTDQLVAAGATTVVGTHAHVLQGYGFRPDGHFVAYGLGNYLWWRSFGNTQDDNGILTLTYRDRAVVAARFAPAHLDSTGVPVPASGVTRQRIESQLTEARSCTNLSPTRR